MKNGYRVYDTDTHIDPGADVLERYVDPGFRARLADLAPYKVAIKSRKHRWRGAAHLPLRPAAL